MALLRSGFPIGLEIVEKWEGIFQPRKSQIILNRLEKSGKSQKIMQNTGKFRNFRKMLFVIFSDISMNYVLFAKMDKDFSLKKNKALKKYIRKSG